MCNYKMRSARWTSTGAMKAHKRGTWPSFVSGKKCLGEQHFTWGQNGQSQGLKNRLGTWQKEDTPGRGYEKCLR